MSEKKLLNISLVGLWFHSYGKGEDKDSIEWQGQVIGQETENYYLVRLHNWISGAGSQVRIVPLNDMRDWTFYETNKQMNEAYELYSKRHP